MKIFTVTLQCDDADGSGPVTVMEKDERVGVFLKTSIKPFTIKVIVRGPYSPAAILLDLWKNGIDGNDVKREILLIPADAMVPGVAHETYELLYKPLVYKPHGGEICMIGAWASKIEET